MGQFAVAQDLGELYDAEYYRTGCGPVPYSRSEPQWSAFFGMVADQLIRIAQPNRVLDAGCAMGFLVEAFWDRGVEAWGIDVSPYALSQVRRDMQPYCRLGSIADPLDGRYDAIVCIEVLEHMPEDQGRHAIANLTGATDTILFSSTPYDLQEATHFNVRPILWWLELFRDYGFAPDFNVDASFVCDHAILFRQTNERVSDDVLALFARFVRQKHEIVVRDKRVHETRQELQTARDQLHELESVYEEIQANLEAANLQLTQLIETRMAGEVEVKSLIQAQSAQIQSLESRVQASDAHNAELGQQVRGILESRIWRTLVKGGGVLQRFLG